MTKSAQTTRPTGNRSWRPLLAEGLVLMVFWLLMSGQFKVFHITTGLLSVGFVMWLDRRLGPLTDKEESLSLHGHFFRLLTYLPWLFGQMILSTWHVGKVILQPSRQPSPCLLRFDPQMPNEVSQVIFGNSITLTPGTLTLEIDRGTYWIHALDQPSADGVLSGEMARRVASLFETAVEPIIVSSEIYRNEEEIPW